MIERFGFDHRYGVEHKHTIYQIRANQFATFTKCIAEKQHQILRQLF